MIEVERYLHLSVPWLCLEAEMKHARQPAAVPFTPGEDVPEAGVYELVHENCLSQELQMVFRDGQKFPLCQSCGSRVRFYLQRAVPHISQDRDFKP